MEQQDKFREECVQNDMFNMLENVNSYSATTVRYLLQKKGLHFGPQIHDYYDAYECKITWGEKLPTSDYRIPMSGS